jgi:hypothetical protein
MARLRDWLYWPWMALVWATGALLVLGWPMYAWGKNTASGNLVAFTHESWVAEHVWIGAIGAFLVILGVLVMVAGVDADVAIAGPLLAWPALTWAIGSDATGYALSPAGWISGEAWLGVFVAYAGVMFVSWARWRHSYRMTIRAYEAANRTPAVRPAALSDRPGHATVHVGPHETKRQPEDGSAAKPLVEAGGFADKGVKTTGIPDLGYRCAACGFRSWFKKCSRCGGECFRETSR